MQPGEDDLFNLAPPAPEPSAAPGEPGAEPPKRDVWAALDSLTTVVTGLADAVKSQRAAPPAEPPKPVAGFPEQPAAGTAMGSTHPIVLELNAKVSSGAIRSQEDLAAFWDDKFIRSPGAAAVAQQQLTQMIAQEAASKATRPLNESTGLTALDNFRRDHLSDPMFLNPEVRKKFDALIDDEKARGTFASLNQEQIRSGLEHVFNSAIGQVARERAQGSSAEERMGRPGRPPLYPVGSGAGGFGSRESGGGGMDMSPHNEIERQLLDSAKEYGMSKEDTAAALRELRADAS